MSGNILVVDDEKLVRVTLQLRLEQEGYRVWAAPNAFHGLEVMAAEAIDVVVTDLRMPSMDGLEFQRRVLASWPDVAIVFITAFGTVATAVEAMRQGAADFLTKPVNTDELMIRVHRLVQRRGERQAIARIRASVPRQELSERFVFRSSLMRATVDRALSLASADASVLLEGETGTGKRTLARLLHERSARADGAFVVVVCAGLAADLLASELFGHEAGAMGAATRARKGGLELASGGTLLVEEVDCLPPVVQVQLARCLEERAFMPVGGERRIPLDARLVCTTRRSVPELVAAGQFREDLHYRLAAGNVVMPPLRARREDIVPLAERFAARAWSARGHTTAPEIAPEALRLLLAHGWPGNVRELEQAIEHAAAIAAGSPIGVDHLPPQLAASSPAQLVTLNVEGQDAIPYDQVVVSCERLLLDWALARAQGNQTHAAELLKISRTTLRSRLASVRAETTRQGK